MQFNVGWDENERVNVYYLGSVVNHQKEESTDVRACLWVSFHAMLM
jgi:hypothetical protein